MFLYACTIFLSAFLLFAVQPMIGKIILPWFGGSAAVWSTCLMFFQAALLAGYLYAHWSTRPLKPKRQAVLHVALLAISLALLPILPVTELETDARRRPVAAHPAAADRHHWLAVHLALHHQSSIASLVRRGRSRTPFHIAYLRFRISDRCSRS